MLPMTCWERGSQPTKFVFNQFLIQFWIKKWLNYFFLVCYTFKIGFNVLSLSLSLFLFLLLFIFYCEDSFEEADMLKHGELLGSTFPPSTHTHTLPLQDKVLLWRSNICLPLSLPWHFWIRRKVETESHRDWKASQQKEAVRFLFPNSSFWNINLYLCTVTSC